MRGRWTRYTTGLKEYLDIKNNVMAIPIIFGSLFTFFCMWIIIEIRNAPTFEEWMLKIKGNLFVNDEGELIEQ